MSSSPPDSGNQLIDATTGETPLSSVDENHAHNASAEAAGIVRGFARSVGRSVARLPIGSLPRRAVFRRRLPVRQVAKLSDRIATGLDLFSSAVESTEGKQRMILSRVTSFATSLLKNTLLGAAVFEAYGFTILKLSPKEETFQRKVQVEDDEGNTQVHIDEKDEFARASLSAHYGAGLVAGTVHGVASTFLETKGASNMFRALPAMTVHHAMAHSLLFGSYESIKRALLSSFLLDDDGTHFYGGEYLASFWVAGGLAGQIQHVASHYTEQLLGISEGSAAAPQGDARGLMRVAFTPRSLSSLAAPAVRPIILAFPPSAIGFIAFEYGKKFLT